MKLDIDANVNIRFHDDGDGSANRHLFEQILAHIRSVDMNVKDIQASIDTLGQKVTALETVEASTVTLLNGLSATIAQLKEQLAAAVAANDPVAVQAAIDALGALGQKVDTDSQTLADAVTANTPS
jgi:biotin carboxylase